MTDLEFRDIHQDPPYQASKWQQIQLLIETSELQDLFQEMGNVSLYQLGGVLSPGEGVVSQEEFLTAYTNYLDHLKKGQLPEKTPLFTCAISGDQKALYAVKVANGKQLIRIRRPVIQVQEHLFDYSRDDNKFRSMVFGLESVTWGLQFSYPQLFTDPKTHAIQNVLRDGGFPNTKLFKKLQKWVRQNTLPTPFIVQGKKTNSPIRLGRGCCEWINKHPQLKSKGIKVDEPS